MKSLFYYLICFFLFISCSNNHIKEYKQWSSVYGEVNDGNGLILRDHLKDNVYYWNKEALVKFLPVKEFGNVLTSMVALEEGVVKEDNEIIAWIPLSDSNDHSACRGQMNLRSAFSHNCNDWFYQLNQKLGYDLMKHYFDSIQLAQPHIVKSEAGNISLDSVMSTGDEMVGFLKRIYFNELPFTDRTQRLLRTLLLKEDKEGYKLHFGYICVPTENNTFVNRLYGILEVIVEVEEVKGSMNNSNVRMYPYFFAQDLVSNTPLSEAEQLDKLTQALKIYGIRF